MKLDIPYYSQHRDIEDEYWQKRACGLVCLKMILDYSGKENVGLKELLKLALRRDVFGENGWVHSGLIALAKGFDVDLIRKEFRSKNKEEEEKLRRKGLAKLIQSLQNKKPVIVSVVKRFKFSDRFHQVVLNGFEKEGGIVGGFYYNDSDYQSEEEGKNVFVDLETFEKYWRGLAIFIV